MLKDRRQSSTSAIKSFRNVASFLDYPSFKVCEPYVEYSSCASQANLLIHYIHAFDLGYDRPLVVTAILNKKIKAKTMIDTGASKSFIDEQFVKYHLVPRLKKFSDSVHVVDD